MPISMYVRTYVCMYACDIKNIVVYNSHCIKIQYVCMYLCMYICIYVCIRSRDAYVCIHICMYDSEFHLRGFWKPVATAASLEDTTEWRL